MTTEYVRQSVYRNQEAQRQPAHSLPLHKGDDEAEARKGLKSIEEIAEDAVRAVKWS